MPLRGLSKPLRGLSKPLRGHAVVVLFVVTTIFNFPVVDCLMMTAGDSNDEGAALQNVTF